MKNKKILITTITVFLIISIMAGVKKANDWFNTHYFVFNQPIKVDVKTPIEVKIRKPQIIERKIVLDYPEEMIDTPIKKYIVDKFGPLDAKVALGIVEAESGFNPEAVNLNGGKSLDTGLFQINSVHWKREGCSLKELVDPYKNTDCAFQIFKEQGWTPWVAYNNKSYLVHLEE